MKCSTKGAALRKEPHMRARISVLSEYKTNRFSIKCARISVLRECKIFLRDFCC